MTKTQRIMEAVLTSLRTSKQKQNWNTVQIANKGEAPSPNNYFSSLSSASLLRLFSVLRIAMFYLVC